MNIAFLGLGRMGRILASHVNAKHNLTVWNRSPAARPATWWQPGRAWRPRPARQSRAPR